MSAGGTLILRLAPSRRLAVVLLGLHAAAAGAVLPALPLTAGVPVAALIMLLGVLAVREYALLRGARSVHLLGLRDDAHGTATHHDRRESLIAPDGRRYVGRHWVSLPMRGGVRGTVLVTSDMLGAREFRALRIWALWGRLCVAPSQPAGGN